MPYSTVRLCGISSRFQLLSPGMGQVAHALLTRPPLSHRIFISEENQIKCFVRLACVKHAASVHPEPGSNSHVMMLFSKRMTSLCCFRVAELSCSTSRYSFEFIQRKWHLCASPSAQRILNASTSRFPTGFHHPSNILSS